MSRVVNYDGPQRASGEPRIGNIPEHWSVFSLKRWVAIYNGSTPKSGVTEYWDGDVPWVTPADLSGVNGGGISAGARSITTAGYESCGTSMVPQGSVIISTRAPIGTLAISEVPLCTNQGCKSLVPINFDSSFLCYSLSVSTTELIVRGRGTTFLELPTEELGSFRMSAPSLEEQTQIAKFLDYETAKIDALIDKQQQLIALLKEKRQAVISHAVTKGLDPNAPLKDSGVEWLGKVPAHWGVINLNRVVDTFVDYRGRTPEKTDEGRPLVTAGAIKNGFVDFERSPQFVSEETYHLLRQRGVPEVGDLLFTSEAPLGEVALVEDTEIACAQRIIMFKMNRQRMLPEYLWLYLRSQSGADEILTKASGSTAEGIRADRLRRSRVPVPPLDEQRSISKHVEDTLSGFDAILGAAAAQTELLQERRTALISAAVTGKIDVRGWKAPESDKEVA